MTELDINHLSTKIQALLQSHQNLRKENDSLKTQLIKLQQEYTSLLAKNQQASNKIRDIITQLRKQAP